jgi:hypothetical protein
MAVGQIGFFTTAIEALAAAVGGGMLLGGFAAGSVGVVAGWPRSLLDRWVLLVSYFGGLIGLILAVLDSILRYGL